MGMLEKMRSSHIGPKRSVIDMSAGPVSLPIFKGPVFDPTEHRVRNWVSVPGEYGFPGLDHYGWGLHPNGMIDCINLPACQSFDGSIRDWGTLWSMEATGFEMLVSQADPAAARVKLLKRLIVRVLLNPSMMTFIPDPKKWDVQVVPALGYTSLPNGISGSLVLQRMPTKDNESTRLRGYADRGGPWEDKLGMEAWPNNPPET